MRDQLLIDEKHAAVVDWICETGFEMRASAGPYEKHIDNWRFPMTEAWLLSNVHDCTCDQGKVPTYEYLVPL